MRYGPLRWTAKGFCDNNLIRNYKQTGPVPVCPVINMAEQCLKGNAVVGAICGATIALAGNGLLDRREHTSNNLDYLKMFCPNYAGEEYYKKELAVTDGNLITATGIAPLEFTLHVLKILDVFSDRALNAWYNLYKTNETKYFFELMDSIQ